MTSEVRAEVVGLPVVRARLVSGVLDCLVRLRGRATARQPTTMPRFRQASRDLWLSAAPSELRYISVDS